MGTWGHGRMWERLGDTEGTGTLGTRSYGGMEGIGDTGRGFCWGARREWETWGAVGPLGMQSLGGP